MFDDELAVNVAPLEKKFPYHSLDDHPNGSADDIFHASVPTLLELAEIVYTPGAVKLPNMDPFDDQNVSRR